MIVHGVWYRTHPMREVSLAEAFDRDRGTLKIEDHHLEFKSDKNNIMINNILRLRYGLAGNKGLNTWVHVTYNHDGAVQDAYFADGKFLGYFGILGGTKRIWNQVVKFVPNPKNIEVDKAYMKTQKQFFGILAMAILI